MKHIHVVAAIIEKNQKIFACQRSYGEFKGLWEFPGGKVEEGESLEEALQREIKEELAIEIAVEDLLDTIHYDYPNFHLEMDCFWCKLKGEEPRLLEAQDAIWLSAEELETVDWLEADIALLPKISEKLESCER